MGKLLKIVISIGLIFFLAPVSSVLAQGEDEILAKVGNEVITRIDFETRLKSFLPYVPREQMKDFEKLKQLLDSMIKARLLVVEGTSKGLIGSADIQAKLRMIRDDFIAQEYVKAYIEKSVAVSDEEVERYYHTDPDMREREYLKVSQIVVGKQEEAMEILDKVKKGENFKKLVKERSIDEPSKLNFGELDWFEKREGMKEVEEAVSKLEKGKISDVVKMKENFYIFKLDDRRNVPKPPYLKVKDDIIAKLKYKKISELAGKEIEELKKKITVEAFYDRLISKEK
jgi:parvulin-like peptidyl-prolyl isomerase